MDRRWSTNQFYKSTAISLITILLRRNGFHFATTAAAAGTQLEYFTDLWVVLFKIHCMITKEGILGLIGYIRFRQYLNVCRR